MLGLGFGLSITSQALRGLLWPGNSAPTGLPTISGTATEGQSLTVSTAGIADADGLGAFAYQWLRAGAPIGGATSTTYLLQAADVGSTISVRVSWTDGMGKPESLTSVATSVVQGLASRMQLESGDYLLLESGDRILLEA